MPGLLHTLRERLGSLMQNRSSAPSPDAMQHLRHAGTAAAYRRCTSLFLLVQFMLWAALQGIAIAGRSAWIPALVLIPVSLGVYAVSRWVWGERQNREPDADGQSMLPPSRPGWQSTSRCWELLILLICPALDAVWLLQCLTSLLHRLMPSYPLGILRVALPVMLTLATVLGKRNGTAYGISLWRWLLPLAAVWVMLSALRNHGTEQLYPLLGKGWLANTSAALSGLGALWPCPLLFLLPECSLMRKNPYTGKKPRTVFYVLLPAAAGCLLALILGCLGAWHSASGSIGLRLLLVGRSSGNMMLSGLWALFWLLGLMTAFCTALMATQKLTQRVWPGCSDWFPVLAAALPAAVCLWVQPDTLPTMLIQLLPWRFLLWALAAAGAAIRRGSIRKSGHRA